MTEKKRLFVGGLFPGINYEDIKERFSRFGEISSIEIKRRNNVEGTPSKTFAYIDISGNEAELKKCISMYNNVKWKGNILKIQAATENFLERLEKERIEEKENPGIQPVQKERKKKKGAACLVTPLDGVPGVENFQKKGAPPGPLPGQENWVVGKYGRVLPVVNLKKKGSRKMLKVDPSKLTHNVKRMADEKNEQDVSVSKLSWAMDVTENEITKKRKGEFPEWKAPPRKKKPLPDIELFIRNDVTEAVPDDFEIVRDLMSPNSKNDSANTKKSNSIKAFSSKALDLSRFDSDTDSEIENNSVIGGKTELNEVINGKSSLKTKTKQGSGLKSKALAEKKKVTVPTFKAKVSVKGTTKSQKCLVDNIMDEFYSGTQYSADISKIEDTKTDSDQSSDEYSDFETFAKVEEEKIKRLKGTTSSGLLNDNENGNDAALRDKTVYRKYCSDSDSNDVSPESKVAIAPVISNTISKTINTSLKNHKLFCNIKTKLNESLLKNDTIDKTVTSNKMSSKTKNVADFVSNHDMNVENESEESSTDSSDSSDMETNNISKGNKTSSVSNLSTSQQKKVVENLPDSDDTSDETEDEETGSGSNSSSSDSDSEDSIPSISINSSKIDKTITKSMENVKNKKVNDKEIKEDDKESLKSKKDMEISESEDNADSSESENNADSSESENNAGTPESENNAHSSESENDADTSDSEDAAEQSKGEEASDSDFCDLISKEMEKVESLDNHSRIKQTALKQNKKEEQKNEININKFSEKKSKAGLKEKASLIYDFYKSDSTSNDRNIDEDCSKSEINKEKHVKASESGNDKIQSCTLVKDSTYSSVTNSDEIGDQDTSGESESDAYSKSSENENDFEDLISQAMEKVKTANKDTKKNCKQENIINDKNSETFLHMESRKAVSIENLHKNDSSESDSEDSSYKPVDTKELLYKHLDKLKEKNELEKQKAAAMERKVKNIVVKPEISEKKRQEALMQRQKEHTSKQSAIKSALSNIDSGGKSNKKIVFDSDGEGAPVIVKVPKKKGEKREKKDKPAKQKPGAPSKEVQKPGVIPEAVKKACTLFDSSSDSEVDDTKDKLRFGIRPEFEGAVGKKLMKLQSRYGNDDRFKLTANFAESDSGEDSDIEDSDDEKTKSLKILQSVVNTDLTKLVDKKAKQKRQFKDVSQLKYDPSKKEHSQFEVQPSQEESTEKKSKKKKKKIKETEIGPEPVPEVTKEKFYEVSESVLETFAKKEDKPNTGFSLLAAFGKQISDHEEEMEVEYRTQTPAPYVSHSTVTDFLTDRFKVVEDDKDGKIKKKADSSNTFPDTIATKSNSHESTDKVAIKPDAKKELKQTSTFFFTFDDSRLKDGEQFYRKEDMATVREKWNQNKGDLIKSYKAQQRAVMKQRKSFSRMNGGGMRGKARRDRGGARGGSRGGRGRGK